MWNRSNLNSHTYIILILGNSGRSALEEELVDWLFGSKVVVFIDEE